MVAMLLVISGDMSRHIRVASLLDMALWSTGSYRRADGDEGRIVLEVNATCSEFEGHRLLTAAWSPCIHYSLQHSVLHCRQGYNFNAENTEGVGFPGLSGGLWEEGVSQAVGSS